MNLPKETLLEILSYLNFGKIVENMLIDRRFSLLIFENLNVIFHDCIQNMNYIVMDTKDVYTIKKKNHTISFEKQLKMNKKNYIKLHNIVLST